MNHEWSERNEVIPENLFRCGLSTFQVRYYLCSLESMISLFQNVLRWSFGWAYYVCLICFSGAVLGVLSHLLWGLCFYEDFDPGYMAALGYLHGLKYAGVWSGGTALVLCVIRARREYLEKVTAGGEGEWITPPHVDDRRQDFLSNESNCPKSGN